MKRDGGMTPLSYLVQHLIYSVDILLASKFLSSMKSSNFYANFRNKKARLKPRPKIEYIWIQWEKCGVII